MGVQKMRICKLMVVALVLVGLSLSVGCSSKNPWAPGQSGYVAQQVPLNAPPQN